MFIIVIRPPAAQAPPSWPERFYFAQGPHGGFTPHRDAAAEFNNRDTAEFAAQQINLNYATWHATVEPAEN